MIAELGHFALVLAFGVALFQMVVPMVGASRGWSAWMDSARPAAMAQFGLIGIAFAALTVSFVTSDFSVRLVYENSHSAKPLLYKISGVWGNHEGSMLLWVLILSLFGAAAASFGENLPPSLRARVLGIQAAIGTAFLGFILFTSNPFLRLANPPFDGRDLNPLLQDPGLAFHPPFLYLGYVGLSMSFSFAVAALIEGRVDAAWARWVRPWTLAAWMFLTIGIALGSWWAYYELGWGGFWFWDPVENASFMPWLLAAALLHSAVVVEKRETMKAWTILLAIMAFGFSLIGTFIVRSGVITSVHSFASDPARGVFILAILAVFVGGALTLFAARSGSMTTRSVFAPVSREGALLLNNLLLAVSAFVVFVGTLWPLAAELFAGRKLSVGAPFFEQAFTPFMVALAIALPIGAILPWKRGRIGRAITVLRPALILALAVAALVFAVSTGHSALAVVGAGLGAWLIGGAGVDLWQRAGRVPGPAAAPAARRLGQGDRPCRPGRDLHRGQPAVGVAGRGHPRRPHRRDDGHRRLSGHVAGRRGRAGAELFRDTGDDAGRTRRAADRGHVSRKARLSGAGDAHDRGGDRDRADPRHLSGHRRRAAGWRLGRAQLRQALRRLDLGGGGADGAGGAAEPERPALSHRGRQPAPRRRKRGACGMSRWPILPLVLLLACAQPVLAVQPDEMLADKTLEARARDISRTLRCPVCQGENIDDSNAPISRDLRLYVRERLTNGDSDAQVIDAVTTRFGEFVLFEPRARGANLILWLAGPAMALIGLLVAWLYIRRRTGGAMAGTDAAERRGTRPAGPDHARGRLGDLVKARCRAGVVEEWHARGRDQRAGSGR